MIFTGENDIWKRVNVGIALHSSCPGKHKLISTLCTWNTFFFSWILQSIWNQWNLTGGIRSWKTKRLGLLRLKTKHFGRNANWKMEGKNSNTEDNWCDVLRKRHWVLLTSALATFTYQKPVRQKQTANGHTDLGMGISAHLLDSTGATGMCPWGSIRLLPANTQVC